jgi:hypothetical protein
MLTDCERCALRDITCPECVITVMPDGQAGLGAEEIRALRVLADAGLVPSLSFTAGTVPAASTAVPEPVAAGGNVGRGPSGGAGSRPADTRSGRGNGSSHPRLKSHGPQPTLHRDRQDRAESRRIG